MKEKEVKRVKLFLVFVLLFQIPLTQLYANQGKSVYLSLLMVTPALSMILTRLITKEGFKDIKIKLDFKKNVKYYCLHYFAPVLVSGVGVLIYFIIFSDTFDPMSSKYAISSGVNNIAEYCSNLMVLVPAAVILNPIGGLIQCFGEEVAWRGYMLEKLQCITTSQKVVIITNTVWGLWHAPIVYLGFNYGESQPLLGILAMVIFCNVIGTICSHGYIKSGSIWLPVVFHASINALDKIKPSNLLMGTPSNPFIGPDLIGIIGGIGFIVWSAHCYKEIGCPHVKGAA